MQFHFSVNNNNKNNNDKIIVNNQREGLESM